MSENKSSMPQSPDQLINEQIERNRSFERSAEGALERIASTTLPHEIRMAVRDAEFDFVDAPPGLGDNWGIQRLYAGLEERRRFLARLHPLNESKKDAARRAIGLGIEPWRDTPIVTLQDETELMRRSRDQGMPADAIVGLVKKTKLNALERVPVVLKELPRSRAELVRIRKVYFLYWNYKNTASGNEVGELYVQNKIANLPRPKDFALMLQMPSYFMTEEESTISIPDSRDPSKTIKKLIPDYPQTEDVGTFLTEEGRSKENEPTGETTEKEARLLYLVALSENPERAMEWKHRTEQAEMFKLYRKAGVSQAYLILKEKGINYVDPIEEAKIKSVHDSLTTEDIQRIKDSWWNNLGFSGNGTSTAEQVGILEIGDPEMWIPTKARRGDPPAGSVAYFGEGFDGTEFDRKKQIEEINKTLVSLKEAWQRLSPLNNTSISDRQTVRLEIEKLTDYIRGLTTCSKNDGKGNLVPVRNEKGEIVTMFGSLPLERELGIRRGATEIGCIWSKPQRVGDKEKIMEAPDSPLQVHVGGDLLAFENAKLIVDMFGFAAKWGYYARDYDPAKDPERNGTPLAYTVDVEAWPYTSEFQNILAFPWLQSYKKEAGGPSGSRCRFGPLMTDYPSAYSSPEFYDSLEVDEEKRGKPMYDEAGNPEYVILDKTGKLSIGRADEGIVICDTNFTLLEHWERGESLSETRLWNKMDEDPLRRFLLRSFFAEGKAALGPGGNSLLETWKKRDWKLEDLDSDKFWDDYKLARRVSLRRELLGEVVWANVVRPIDDKYKVNIGKIVGEIQRETDPGKRLNLIQSAANLHQTWQEDRLKEVFNYSDQMFWNGVASTEGALSWFKGEPGLLEQFKGELPSTIIDRIIRRSQKCSVNLLGTYTSKDMSKLMKGEFKII
jgi:hypothetical protein